jgi:hypothetical protein
MQRRSSACVDRALTDPPTAPARPKRERSSGTDTRRRIRPARPPDEKNHALEHARNAKTHQRAIVAAMADSVRFMSAKRADFQL